jgi:hypothetical protein
LDRIAGDFRLAQLKPFLGQRGLPASNTGTPSKWHTKAEADQQDFSHKKLDKTNVRVHPRTIRFPIGYSFGYAL